MEGGGESGNEGASKAGSRAPSAAFDFVSRLILVVFFGFVAAGSIHRLADGSLAAEGPISLADGIAQLLFSALVCALVVFRRAPLRSASGWAPKAAALGGSFLFTLVNLLPSPILSTPAQSLVLALLVASTALLCLSLATLGRSFSILPEARALVVAGPYSFVRHPVYVAEAAAAAAMAIAHFSAAAVVVALVQTALQFVRVVHEEAVLTEEFPEYAAYAAATPRFLPKFGRRPSAAASAAADESGAAAVLLAILLPALVGMTALGVEVSSWYGSKRQLQSAADAAALSAAYQVFAGQNDAAAAAASDASANGFVSGGGASLTLNTPPASGPYAGDAAAAEVILSQPQTILMAGAFLPSLAVTARAVARVAANSAGKYCALGLDTSATNTVFLNNNAVLPNPNCGVASNSTSQTGLNLSNNASIAGPVSVAANGYGLSNNATITGAITKGNIVSDPYSGVVLPTRPSCTGQTSSGSNNVTVNLTPGTFCSGLSFQNGAVVNMAAGVYFIQSKFSFQNNATLNATAGTTIVIDGTYAISVNNNALINITAPSSGSTAGVALMGPRNGSPATTQVFSNNTQLNIRGAIYFPTQTVELDNNASSDPNGCVQLIAQRLKFQNNAELPSSCSGTPVRPIGTPSAVFVE